MNYFVSRCLCWTGICLFTTTIHGFSAELNPNAWPAWRGALSAGSVEKGSYPKNLLLESDFEWKLKLPGRGCSTPIVSNDKIILTSAIGKKNGVLAFDFDGNELWKTTLENFRQGKHRNGSGTNPSAVTDGKHIFVYFKSGVLASIDFDGNLLWQTNLQEKFGRDTLYWDLGTSPVLTKEHVVVAVMHGGDSFLVAYEKNPADKKAEQAWKVNRMFDCPVEGDHSYATPIVVDKNGKETILVWGAEHVTAHDAKEGVEIWKCGGFNPKRKSNWVTVGSPVVVDDVLVTSYGRGANLHGIRIGGSGNVTKTNRLWKRDNVGCFVTTPVAYKNRVYILGDQGKVSCVDPKTGDTIWSDKLPKHRKKFYASPTIANGKLYAAREDGVVFVCKIDDSFELLSTSDLKQQIIASPVPVANRLILRGENHLFLSKAQAR